MTIYTLTFVAGQSRERSPLFRYCLTGRLNVPESRTRSRSPWHRYRTGVARTCSSVERDRNPCVAAAERREDLRLRHSRLGPSQQIAGNDLIRRLKSWRGTRSITCTRSAYTLTGFHKYRNSHFRQARCRPGQPKMPPPVSRFV